MLDEMSIDKKRELYGKIIHGLLPHFRELYKEQDPNRKLPLATYINNGDCYVMATLVYHIAQTFGLSPVIYGGGWHVWVQEDDFIFDAYFPHGITQKGVKELQVNDMGDDEPPFYQGGPAPSVSNLNGYFSNGRDRAIWVEYLLKPYGVEIPTGLRKFLKRKTKYRRINRLRDAMRRFTKRLGDRNYETRIRLG